MPSTPHAALIVRRKRAASVTEFGVSGVFTKSESSPDPQSTPPVQDLPELDWSDTPKLEYYSLATPSPIATPSKLLSTYKEVQSTPTRIIRETRKSHPLNACNALQFDQDTSTEKRSFKLDTDRQKSTLLFPLCLYPPEIPRTVLNIKNTGTLDFVSGDIGQKSFKFLGLSEASQNLSKPNTQKLAAVTPLPSHPLQRARGHLRKRLRVKDEESNIGQKTQSKAGKAVIAQPVQFSRKEGPALNNPAILRRPPNKTEVTQKGAANKELVKKSILAGVTRRRFTRILPFDTLERLINAPSICVASLVGRPNKRCSLPARSSGYSRNSLLSMLSALKDASNLPACESYLRKLVDSVTCENYHHSIASEQLQRLLDRYQDRRSKEVGNKHDFTSTDIESTSRWLKALTTIPGEQSLLQIFTSCEAYQSTNEIASYSGSDSLSNKPLFDGINVLKTTTCISTLRTLETNESRASPDTIEAAQILYTVETAESVALIQTPDQNQTSGEDQPCEPTRFIETTRVVENTQSIEDVQTLHGDDLTIKRSESLVTKTAEATQTITKAKSAKKHSTAETKTSTAAMKTERSHLRFNRKQVVDIDFMGTLSAKSLTQKAPTLAEEREKVSGVKFVNALHQQFRFYYRGASLQTSVNEHINRLLRKSLSPQDENKKGFIYMYWIAGSFNFVKIGLTSRTTTERLNEWSKLCGHEIQEFTKSVEEPGDQLPHIHRVEALVHAELREARLEEIVCKGCRGGHIEWFAVSPAYAQKVINKWSKWIRTEPYVEGELKSSIIANGINALCTPVELSVRGTASFAALRPETRTEPLMAMEEQLKWTRRLRPRRKRL
jgi:T5orf172 domain